MKKALLKRYADALEKLAVGSILVGLFHGNSVGFWIGFGCMIGSNFLTWMESRV